MVEPYDSSFGDEEKSVVGKFAIVFQAIERLVVVALQIVGRVLLLKIKAKLNATYPIRNDRI